MEVFSIHKCPQLASAIYLCSLISFGLINNMKCKWVWLTRQLSVMDMQMIQLPVAPCSQ